MAKLPFTTATPKLKQAIKAFAQNDFLAAIQLCDECLRANLNDLNAWHLKGRCLTAGGLYELARKHLKNALLLSPNEPTILVSLGRLEIAQGDSDAALKWLNDALQTHPNCTEAALERGKLLERMGEYASALEDFQSIESGDPWGDDAERSIAQLHLHAGDFSKAVDQSQTIMDRTGKQSTVYRQAAFVQGKALDKLGEFDRAMAAWKKANVNCQTNFDRSEFLARIDAYIETYNQDIFPKLPRSSCESTRPVFIVGMPRSGTTLVEQILGSHNCVFSAGELRHIEILNHSIPDLIQTSRPMPMCLADIQPQTLDQIADRHLSELDALSCDQNLHVVNKSLENYWFVGLLHQMYPMAKFIFVRRNPFDNALSVFSNWFNPHKYSYSYTTDLGDIGFVYRQIEKLMNHWARVLPHKSVEIQYEDLVANPEHESRKMISHLGLDWDPQCLDFHQNKRLVLTLSYAQVNRPIYHSSQDRWKPYEKHLGELQESLAQSGS